MNTEGVEAGREEMNIPSPKQFLNIPSAGEAPRGTHLPNTVPSSALPVPSNTSWAAVRMSACVWAATSV